MGECILGGVGGGLTIKSGTVTAASNSTIAVVDLGGQPKFVIVQYSNYSIVIFLKNVETQSSNSSFRATKTATGLQAQYSDTNGKTFQYLAVM